MPVNGLTSRSDRSIPDVRIDERRLPLLIAQATPRELIAGQEARAIGGAARLILEVRHDLLHLPATAAMPQDFTGVPDIQVPVSDGRAQTGAIFVLTVAGVPDAPRAVDDGPLIVARGEIAIIDPARILANDSDPDGDAMTLIGVEDAAVGEVRIGPSGALIYEAPAGFLGEDTFFCAITDGRSEARAKVTLEVVDPSADHRQGTDGADAYVSRDGDAAYAGGDGADIIRTGSGADSVDGGAGGDNIRTWSGADVIRGGAGVDPLDAGGGDDTIFGGDGRDRILAGAGDDLMYGGTGDDSFFFGAGDGRDHIVDFIGNTAERDFASNGDRISLTIEGVGNFDTMPLYASQQEGGVILDFGEGDTIFLRGAQSAAMDKDSFTFV